MTKTYNPETKEWVQDPIRDYSNGATPTQPNVALEANILLLQRQLLHVSNALRAVDQCTKMVDAKTLIRTARASYPFK